MRITVFGAAGRIGSHVVARALGRGHEVVAFVHHAQLALDGPSLVTVTGDVLDRDAVFSAVGGSDGVVFALSHGQGERRDIHEAGIASVIQAMAMHDVRRLAAVSAAGAFHRSDRDLSLGYRALIATSMRHVYDDLEAMENRIIASDLDWTIVRPVGLSDEPASGDYRVALDGSLLPKAARISREDVAALLLKALETDTYRRRTVTIAQ